MNEAGELDGVFAAAGEFPTPYAGEVDRFTVTTVDNVVDDVEDGGSGITVGGPAVATKGLGELGDED